MTAPRQDVQSGHVVAQFFDTVDLFDGSAYDYTFKKVTNIPIVYAARYQWAMDSDNIPQLRQVAGTVGPVGGMLCWPGTTDRKSAQWGYAFHVKVTTASPLKATPVKLADGTLDPTLAELAVTTVDGSAPAVGDFGLVTSGSSLGSQEPIFFAGGGSRWTRWEITSSGNPYNAKQILGGTYVTPVYGPVQDGILFEENGSTIISNGVRVYAMLESDGLYHFVLPMGECAS